MLYPAAKVSPPFLSTQPVALAARPRSCLAGPSLVAAARDDARTRGAAGLGGSRNSRRRSRLAEVGVGAAPGQPRRPAAATGSLSASRSTSLACLRPPPPAASSGCPSCRGRPQRLTERAGRRHRTGRDGTGGPPGPGERLVGWRGDRRREGRARRRAAKVGVALCWRAEVSDSPGLGGRGARPSGDGLSRPPSPRGGTHDRGEGRRVQRESCLRGWRRSAGRGRLGSPLSHGPLTDPTP